MQRHNSPEDGAISIQFQQNPRIDRPHDQKSDRFRNKGDRGSAIAWAGSTKKTQQFIDQSFLLFQRSLYNNSLESARKIG